MVTWSLRNCRSVRRTSKLAFAFCRFFCRRSVACTKHCATYNYGSFFIEKILNKQKIELYLFTRVLQHYIRSQPQAYRVHILNASMGIYAFWHFEISNQILWWKCEWEGCLQTVYSPDNINTIQTLTSASEGARSSQRKFNLERPAVPNCTENRTCCKLCRRLCFTYRHLKIASGHSI